MTKQEIINRIENIERQIFIESMADFMNWNKFYQLQNELHALQMQLKEED